MAKESSIGTVDVVVSQSTTAKPGYKTTEFWGKVFVQLVILLAMGGVLNVAPETAEQYGLQIIAGLEATYQGARSLAKFPRTPVVETEGD